MDLRPNASLVARRHPQPITGRGVGFYLGVLSIAAITCIPEDTSAAEYEWEVGLASRYTDNIDMTPDNGEDELSLIPSGSLSMVADGPRLYADVEGLVRHYNYTKDTNSDETQYYADVVLDFHLSPDLLDWRVENHLSNEPIESADADTPDNRQNVNIFFTGPELMLRFGQRDNLDITAGYIRTSAEESDSFDSDRWVARGEWMHSFSSRLDAGLAVEWEDVSFDDLFETGGPLGQVDGDYERNDFYGTGSFTRGSNIFLFEAGYTDIDYVDRKDEDGQRLFGQLTRTVSETDTWEILYRDLYTDAARALDGQPSLGLGGITVSTDIYRLSGARFNYEGLLWAAETELTLASREEDYVQDVSDILSSDRDVNEAFLAFTWPLTARTGWINTLSWADYDYKELPVEGTNQSRDDTETWVITGLEFQLRRRMEMRLQVGWHAIDSNDPGIDADETLAQLAFTWSSR